MPKEPLLLVLLILDTAFWGISYPVAKAGVGVAALPYSFQTYTFAVAALAVAGLFPR